MVWYEIGRVLIHILGEIVVTISWSLKGVSKQNLRVTVGLKVRIDFIIDVYCDLEHVYQKVSIG